MTPGIQQSNVKMRLRKKLAMRPVISTASGGNTTQKKYRSAFIGDSSSSAQSSSFLFGCLLIRPSTSDNLRSPDLTTDPDRAGAASILAHHFALRSRSPCISQFAHSGLQAFPGAASHHARRFLVDPAPRLLA